MFEIAGGILIAVAVLVTLPYILAGAYWAVVIGIGLAIVIGGWCVLAAFVGEGWAAAAIMVVGASVWVFNILQDSEWNERRITKSAERETETPYGISDSLGVSLLVLSVLSVIVWALFMALPKFSAEYASELFITISFMVPVLFFALCIWHYNRFVTKYQIEDYRRSNLMLIAWGKSLAIFFTSLVFIPMIMVAVVSSLNSDWGENGVVLWSTALGALALCGVIAKSTYREVIQKGLPSIGEN